MTWPERRAVAGDAAAVADHPGRAAQAPGLRRGLLFTEVVDGQPLPEPWASVDFEADPDWTWHSAAGDSGDALRGLWAERLSPSRGIAAAQLSESAAAGLSKTHPVLYWGDQEGVSLRWVLTHMIEEYARHLGHADLIRESIDGKTGD